MNPNIIKHPFTDYSDWLALRKRLNLIGGTDVATIMGMNPYASNVELFHIKLGNIPSKTTDNMAMMTGRYLEPMVRQVMQYWSGSDDSIIENIVAGNIIRNILEVKSIIQNPDYPHLAFSMDGIVEELGSDGFCSGELGFEAKTVNGMALKLYKDNLPPHYIVQAQAGMLVSGLDKWMVCTFVLDTRHYKVNWIDRDEEMIADILRETLDFDGRVKEAREIQESDLPEHIKQAYIDDLEPTPDYSSSYYDYLKNKFKEPLPTLSPIQATPEQIGYAACHKAACERIKQLEQEEIRFKSQLIEALGFADTLLLGENGTVTYKGRKDGVRVFKNNIKNYQDIEI
jgi:putative phage-type endonuclease